MLPIEGEHDMWWIIGVLAVCIGGACVAQWREWHVKQSTAGRDVETDYLRHDEEPAIGWDEVPGSVLSFRVDEPRKVTHPPRRGRSPLGGLPEMFDVVDAGVVELDLPGRAAVALGKDPYEVWPELYGPAEMARREVRLRTWAVVHPDEEPPASSLPAVAGLELVALEYTTPEHSGADETWADQLAEIKEQEGRLLPEGVADPEIDEFYASLSTDDIEDARWRAEMAEWDRQAERDFRRLDNILEAERQRVIAALTETWGLEFRDECKRIDIRDNEIHQRVVDAELAAIASSTTVELVMA
jgi:hypothetical protein